LATRVERRRYKWLKATSKRMVMGPFDCPSCGAELYFSRDSKQRKVMAKCSQCGISGEWDIIESLEPVDYYNKLVDEYRAR